MSQTLNGDLESGHCLFDPKILDEIELNELLTQICSKGNFKLRPLEDTDYQKGYLQLLSQLTTVGKVDECAFRARFNQMKSCGDHYYIVVVEDLDKKQTVGTSSLVMEYKFIHNTGLRGRLEDVVVREDYRGKRLGLLLVECVKKLAQKFGCYKLSLDCSDNMIEFYKSCDFKQEEGRANSLVLRFSS